MKLAVISDVHGNYKALEAFLTYIQGETIDGIICLGDYITDSPYPERTMKLLYEMMNTYSCYMLRGNREDYMIQNYYHNQGWKPSSANGTLLYTAEHLSKEDILFFESIPTTKILELNDVPALTLCHGTIDEVRGNVVWQPELKERVLHQMTTSYLLGGHTHHQEYYQLPDSERVYLNPGSLGLAINGVGRQAQFAILNFEGERWQKEFFTIPYDVDGFLKDFTESGLDEMGMVLSRAVKKTLVTGVNYFFQCILETERLAGVPQPVQDEDIWMQVAKKFEIQ